MLKVVRQGMLIPAALLVGRLFPLVLTSSLQACPQPFLYAFGCP